jgi:hypothetical protein
MRALDPRRVDLRGVDRLDPVAARVMAGLGAALIIAAATL